MASTKTKKKSKPAQAVPFGKPKAKKGDGNFEFQLPKNLGSGRGRIPKGKYLGRCTSIVADTSKSSGNPMWTWEFVITKGEFAGRDFKLWTVLTDDAAWKVVETLKALGVEVEAGEKIRINKKDVIGVGVTMHIKDDAGQDGDGEFSKLDKVSAHPKGAGFKNESSLKAKASEPDDEEEDLDDDDDDTDLDDADDDDLDDDADDDDEDNADEDDADDDDLEDLDDLDDDDDLDLDDDDDDEEDEPPVRKSKTKKPAAKAKPAKSGKAKAALGKRR